MPSMAELLRVLESDCSHNRGNFDDPKKWYVLKDSLTICGESIPLRTP